MNGYDAGTRYGEKALKEFKQHGTDAVIDQAISAGFFDCRATKTDAWEDDFVRGVYSVIAAEEIEEAYKEDAKRAGKAVEYKVATDTARIALRIAEAREEDDVDDEEEE